MKKIFVCFLFLVFGFQFSADAQRQRTTAVFDGDIWTRPSSGFYGIGVRLNQPYLIKNQNDPLRILTEEALIVGVQLNGNDNIEYPGGSYQGRRTEYVSINKDSLTITLPNPRDSVNRYRDVGFTYHGFSNQLFKIHDSNYAVRFTDTVFVYESATSTKFILPNVWMGSMTNDPSVIKQKFKPNCAFNLLVYDRRWYLVFREKKY